jgi:hypothetical protein
MPLVQTPSIAAVVEDKNPALGGNLDCGENNLYWGSGDYFIAYTPGLPTVFQVGASGCGFQYTPNSALNVFASVGGNLEPYQVDSFYNLGGDSIRWATAFISGIATNVSTVAAASSTLDKNNHVVLCDATSNNITINLPAAPISKGLQYHVKKIDSTANTVTVDGNGSQIDGELTVLLGSKYQGISIVSDGNNWYII